MIFPLRHLESGNIEAPQTRTHVRRNNAKVFANEPKRTALLDQCAEHLLALLRIERLMLRSFVIVRCEAGQPSTAALSSFLLTQRQVVVVFLRPPWKAVNAEYAENV